MKNLLIFFIIIFSTITSYCQDDLYYSGSLRGDSIIMKSDIENIQYCLGQYHKERFAANCFYAGSLVLGTATLLMANYSEHYSTSGVLLVSAGLSAAVGLVISIDSEKWIKRASIKISPGSVKVYF